MIREYPKVPVFLFLLVLLMGSLCAPAAGGSVSEYGMPLAEGDFIMLGDGYTIDVPEVDLVNGNVVIVLSNDAGVLLKDSYSLDDRFYYDDRYIAVEFAIVDMYSDSYGDIAVIDYLYVDFKAASTGSIVLHSLPDGIEIYVDDYYEGTGYYEWVRLNYFEPGYHSLSLRRGGYEVYYDEFFINSGKTTHISTDLLLDEQTDSSYRERQIGISDDDEAEIGQVIIQLLIIIFLFLFLRGILKARKRGKERKKAKKQSMAPATSSINKAENNTVPDADPQIAGNVIDNSSVSVDGPVPSPVEKTSDAPENSTIPSVPSGNIMVKSAFYYRGAVLHYKVKVENHTTEPLGDIKITLFVPDVFLLKEKTKTISMLEPGEGKTVTFEVRPTGECGDCRVSGEINYYDYSSKKRRHVDMDGRMVSIICPVLKVSRIDEGDWRREVGGMINAGENTRDLEIPAENLFDIVTRVLRDMNMYMIPPESTVTPSLFTGVARFFASGAADLKYAAYVEVVGKRRSRLILKVWAEKEDALTGFYHKILEEIEKRIDIKLFVDDSTSYNINNTTIHETNIKDSMIQRSNIGSNKRTCPGCGREVTENEKFCMNCGKKLD